MLEPSSEPATCASSPLVFGRTWGRFRPLYAVASGGMASVFAAEKRGPGGYVQRVALKVPHPHLWTLSARRAEFAEEARLGCYVNHPNVCAVIDFGEADGIPYLVLEFVRGQTFAALCRSLAARADMCPQRASELALFVLAKACEGLEAIHSACDEAGRALGIVHCDVCPENLMIGYNGSVRVIDLGVAVATGTTREAEHVPWRGRSAYMAPERVEGKPIDRRADVWSVGVMLCEVLLARNPFARATTLETILAIRRDVHISWPALVPSELRAIVQRALSRSPEARFASAKELGQELTRFLHARTGGALSSELREHLARAAEQEPSGRHVMPAASEARLDSCSSPAYSSAIATARPGRARRLTALRSWLAGTGGWRRRRAAGVGLALALACYCCYAGTSILAALAGPALVAGSAAPLTPSPPSQRARAPAALPPRIASSSQSMKQSARAPRATSKKWLSPRLSKLDTRAHDPSATAAHGVLMLGSALGWADVYEGSKRLGSTPLRVQLPSGLHRLTVRPYGEGPARTMTVALRPAQTVKLDIALQW